MARLKSYIRSTLKFLLFSGGGALLLFVLVDNVIMPQYVQQGKTTKVPDVTGLPFDEAVKVLADHGLEGKKAEERPDAKYPVGAVALQNPSAGAEVKFGRGVYLTVSGGEPMVLVPSLRGRTVRDAAFALERFGLTVGNVTYEVSVEFPVNTVMEQAIPESVKVAMGTVVDVTVSQGPSKDQIPVPSLLRKTLAEGERLILQAGFTIGNIVYQPQPDMLPNTIIDQYPRGGELAPIGQAIDLVVTRKGEPRPLHEN